MRWISSFVKTGFEKECISVTESSQTTTSTAVSDYQASVPLSSRVSPLVMVVGLGVVVITENYTEKSANIRTATILHILLI